MRWLRNANITRANSSTEEIPKIQSDYYFSEDLANTPDLAIGNCTNAPLYRDQFVLTINGFTSDNNGYYWCEIVVNNSISQPSQYAWFYAADNTSCTQENLRPFQRAKQPQCAEFHPATTPSMIISNSTMSQHNNISMSTTLSEIISTSKLPEEKSNFTTVTGILNLTTQGKMSVKSEVGMEYLMYIIGFLVVVFLLVTSLLVLLLLLYFCKRQRKCHQKIGKYKININYFSSKVYTIYKNNMYMQMHMSLS